MASTSRQGSNSGLTVRDGRLYIDLDDPDQLPLLAMLELIKMIRVRHEYERWGSVALAAHRIGISRFTAYRVLNRFGVGPTGGIAALEPRTATI